MTGGVAPLLAVQGIRVQVARRKQWITVVSDVSFEVNMGETVGLVGESGCGKSMTALAVMGLLPKRVARLSAGHVVLNGQALTAMSGGQLRRVRGRDIGMVFQDPLTSLNPTLKISTQLMEPLQLHLKLSRQAARQQAVSWLERVGVPSAAQRIDEYPHQFSGGMRQRVMIAMALCCHPQLVLADEPTTALDVSVQDQILRLLKELQSELGTAMVLITHDLGVIAGTTNRVLVMYAGQIVEAAGTDDIFYRPAHPYTRALLAAIPRLDDRREQLYSIPGHPPEFHALPPGCRFAPRCQFAVEHCGQAPQLVAVSAGHQAACWRAGELLGIEGDYAARSA
jgi:oligopeptide/dipeptide ABC transporter ATP-binding protein